MELPEQHTFIINMTKQEKMVYDEGETTLIILNLTLLDTNKTTVTKLFSEKNKLKRLIENKGIAKDTDIGYLIQQDEHTTDISLIIHYNVEEMDSEKTKNYLKWLMATLFIEGIAITIIPDKPSFFYDADLYETLKEYMNK